MKAYDRQGNYLASCVEAEGAAAIVALAGDGATIRNGHALKHAVWTEGAESQPASESYDFVATTIHQRVSPAFATSNYDEAASQRVQDGLEQTRNNVRSMLATIK